MTVGNCFETDYDGTLSSLKKTFEIPKQQVQEKCSDSIYQLNKIGL